MSDRIFLREYRTNVDKKYVGFTPNGGSIKPVILPVVHFAVFMVVIIQL